MFSKLCFGFCYALRCEAAICRGSKKPPLIDFWIKASV